MLLRLTINNRRVTFGCYADEIETAKACDEKAKELFGEFAYLNFRD